MKRLSFEIALLLILGVIVNVAVAWGCTAMAERRKVQWSDRKDIRPGEMKAWAETLGFKWPHPQYEDGFPYSSGRTRGIGIRSTTFHPYSVNVAGVAEIQAGWPCLGFRAAMVRSYGDPAWRIVSGIALESDINTIFQDDQLLPLAPIWPGFAINTIFYAAILWVVWFTPGMVRRRIRRRRGLCPACAYPIGTSPVCTECGAQLPSPSR